MVRSEAKLEMQQTLYASAREPFLDGPCYCCPQMPLAAVARMAEVDTVEMIVVTYPERVLVVAVALRFQESHQVQPISVL